MALKEDLEKQGAWLFKWRSYLPLLFLPLFFIAVRNFELIEQTFGDDIGDLWESIAVVISFLGLGIRCFTVGYVPRGTSGRNTQSQVAETLNTTGMYSVTRNPLYLGNFVIIFGITLFIQVWWLALIVWVGFWFYYERIIFAEEEFLRNKFNNEFVVWAQKTPMIIPQFKNWRNPGTLFSFKTVLRREFTTFFLVVLLYFSTEIAGTIFVEKRFYVSHSRLMVFLVSLVLYCTLLILKKKTNILNVKGR